MERFEKPVFVSCPRQLIREISTPSDALDYLNEWPTDRRDSIFSMVRRLCSRAIDGLVETGAAEKAFVKWAKYNDVLEDIVVAPWVARLRSGHGGASI